VSTRVAEARIESVDALKAFRVALFKFVEAANTALTDADAEAMDTYRWLEGEQRTYWANNVRKATDLVSRCEEALRQKRIFKDASGRTPSAVDEEKALAKARRMKETAEEKLEHVRRYTPRMQREIMLYKGQVQRLATFVAADLPTAAAKLDKMIQTLEQYLALQSTEATSQVSVSQPVAEGPNEIVSDLPTAAPDEEPSHGTP
jgi:hypothetical protein